MTIEEINSLSVDAAKQALNKCCVSSVWTNEMVAARPFQSAEDMLTKASEIWAGCGEGDWLEAFTGHPKIGDVESLSKKYSHTKEWAGNEQGGMNNASMEVIQRLADGNKVYEEKFGFIFIVCATGKSAEEMLVLLEERLTNERSVELKIAAKEQEKITIIRLEKLLA
ncbi:MAG: 2-oxo-4-hydroxy-4-carboxy-5-ureidoimidazoline decarboxylase [Crocinitomicaceae bacterium]|nr:2-oxo-4-hydroxy-4-carboxy-5-ureidoimidazoline decarboxylase [Crocinitomicaceae bacterium]